MKILHAGASLGNELPIATIVGLGLAQTRQPHTRIASAILPSSLTEVPWWAISTFSKSQCSRTEPSWRLSQTGLSVQLQQVGQQLQMRPLLWLIHT